MLCRWVNERISARVFGNGVKTNRGPTSRLETRRPGDADADQDKAAQKVGINCDKPPQVPSQD